MSIEATYLQAEFPDRYRVLGIALQPFSLGHALVLQRLRSPFVVGGSPRCGDLKLGVALCRRRFHRARKLIGSRLLRWHLRLVPILTTARLSRGLCQMSAYVRSAHGSPDCWVEPGSTIPGAPYLEAVKITLMLLLHHSEASALEVPLQLALHDYAAAWELKGRLRLIGEHDERVMVAARQTWEETHGKAAN